MRPARWRRSTHLVVGAIVLLAVVAVIAVAALWHPGTDAAAVAVKPAPAPAAAAPGVTPTDPAAPRPTPQGLAAVLGPLAADPNLGVLGGRVADALTGDELWSQAPATPLQPASTNKVLTSAAALLTLDRAATLTTTVTADPARPGVAVLVGGGDPTLSAAPPGTPTWYRGAARIADLADQVRASGTVVRSVVVDTGFFSGPTFAPGWDPADIAGGDIAPLEPVMLDGGRVQPATADSARSLTPALDAGRALAVALGVDPAAVTVQAGVPAQGAALARVASPPLIERLRVMMSESDNVMAESIGREVAAAVGRPQSFEGAVGAVLAQLASAGVDTGGAALVDSSGLSVEDRLTASTLDGVISAAAGPAHLRLRPLVDLLPIAGGSGTLSNRYLDTPGGLAAAGFLRAKTGSLTATNSLAGIITDQSGRVLTFALLSNQAGPSGRTAIDALAAALRSCGCGG